jgi:hypothetical protein
MALTPGVFINTSGSTQLPWPPATAFCKRPAKHGARREAIATRQFWARATVQEFLTHLIVKPFGPFNPVAKRLTFLPGPIVTIRALKASDVQPQGDRPIQDGPIADTSVSALFDPRTIPLTAGTDEVRISAFEVQFQPVGPDNLAGRPEFWQFEQGFDTLEIHEQGSSSWTAGFSSIL